MNTDYLRKNWFIILMIVLLIGTWGWMIDFRFRSVDSYQETVSVIPATEPETAVIEPTITPRPTCQEEFSPYATLGIPVVSFNNQTCYNDAWLWGEYIDVPREGVDGFSAFGNRLSATTSDDKIYVRLVAIINGGGGYESIQGGELLGVCPEGTAYSSWGNCHVFVFKRGVSVLITYVTGTQLQGGTNYHYVRLYEEVPTPTPVPATPKPGPTIIYIQPPHYEGPIKCFFYNFLGGDQWAHPANRINCP